MTALACDTKLPTEHTPLPRGKPFLTAAWRNLVMLTFEVDTRTVEPYVPRGVELDLYEGRALVSIVAFEFENARFYGVRAPFCGRIPEVNLRLYVQRHVNGRRRPGVVFIKEIAPRRALWIATVANRCYHEHYELLPMRYSVKSSGAASTRRYEYAWKHRGRWNLIDATARGTPFRAPPESEEAFVIDHWFAYTRQPDGTCVERQVAHAPWSIRTIERDSLTFLCDLAGLYGEGFVDALSESPSSAFVSNGSPVGVFRGSKVG